MTMQRIIIISGPTSVGKSDIAIKVAKSIGGEVVSADSMQVYRGMDIGTGKLRPEEMQGIRHHLIDIIDPKDDFNVSRFREMAIEALDDILSRGKVPIIIGGTGFYIKSLLYTKDVPDPGKDADYRNQLRKIADEGGLPDLYEKLKDIDQRSSERINKNDSFRIIRALEYNHSTGKRYSDYCDATASDEPRYDALFFYLDTDRKELYRRMDERVDRMIDEGLVDEVKALLSEGVTTSCTSMNGIGYKEICRYLSGEIPLDEAVRLIKSNTHHYAVRQCTWFRNQRSTMMVDCSDKDAASKEILRAITFSSSCA